MGIKKEKVLAQIIPSCGGKTLLMNIHIYFVFKYGWEALDRI
jgi:hypothetical protein